MPQAPVLRNTCHDPRTCIPQRAGCLPPHTDRVQQDTRPTDNPAPSAQKSGNTTKGATSKPTENEDDPRAQHAAVGAWDNYVDPHPNGDKPRPRDSHATACPAATPPPPQRRGNNMTEDDEVGPRAQHTTAGVQGNYVNPHTDDDEPRPRDDHADPCPAATTPRLPPPRSRRRAAREAELPVGSTRPLHRRAAAKMSPRIRTGPEAVLTAHAPTPSAAAATARRKPDQVPIPEQNFLRSTSSHTLRISKQRHKQADY